MKYSIAFVGAIAGQALATGWGDAGSFNCPANTNNQCDDSQKGGWDFNDLPTGPVSSYNGHSFSGFECEDGSSAPWKRSNLDKRFGGNCLAGAAYAGSGPSFACGDDQPDFSVSQFHVSTEEDHDLEFHYAMPDGSTCKQVSPCQSGGNIVSNDQCGGAKAVTVQLPQTATAPCSVSVYSVSFDCSTASSSVPPTSTPPTYSTPSSAPPPPPPTSTPAPPPSSSIPPPPPTSTPAPPPSSSIPASSSSLPPPPPPSSTPVTSSTPASSAPPSSSPATSSTPASSAPPSSTPTSPIIPPTSSKPSPPPYTVPSISSVPSVPLSTAPSSTPNKPVTPSSSVPSSTIPSSTKSSSTPPGPTPTCPTVLPKCLNTWLFQSGCSDNGDYECYCKQPDFASKVCGCLTAYGADEAEIQEAAGYFMGICAKYVPGNYGFLNGKCPKPSPPPASSTPASSTPASPVPQTQTTVYVTGYTTTCPVGHTVTSGNLTTTLSTPSVSTIYSTTTSTICTRCTAAPPPASTPNGPVTPPASVSPPPPASTTPCVTLTISTTFTVPATYSTGQSYGATIPSSSCATTIVSTITVPQVVITSTAGGSGGLAYPPPTPAVSTPAGPVSYKPASTGFGTTYVPGKTGSAPIPTYTGAAGKLQAGSVAGLFVGLAALAL